MFNILLDPLPTQWHGYRIDPDFQIGIQMMQISTDNEISEREKVWLMADLLFFELPGTAQEITDGVQWFLGGWYTDNSEKSEKDSTPVMDWDMDQWRIYSAFRKQYGIDLNTVKMHFWVFMGLLTTLDECAFTRVADIRGKIVTGKMSADEKEFYRKAKRRYAIGAQEEETNEDRLATEEFLKLAGLR
ncbi:Gp15 family bacteriophage protein [Gallintestinimicrobium sp.]|uniref:Gp15 family bacteriophage protein n=1 Tax=Gallintestinimicrobium sp. TaxID=2981655 RepID=UPI00307C8EF2